MKKILLAIVLVLIQASSAFAANEFGRNFASLTYGVGIGGTGLTAASYQVDSAYVYETSGKAFFCRFSAPATQTNDALTVYFYPTAVTGSPTFKLEIRNANDSVDPDRPDTGTAALATSADVSPTASRWSTFAITSVSLVAGNTYYAIIYNTSLVPATDYASWEYKSVLTNYLDLWQFYGGYTADAFATDPTVGAAGGFPAVLKFASGELLGLPYVVAGSAHANNTNSRGTRVNFPVSVVVNGMSLVGSASGNLATTAIYQGATPVVSVTATYVMQNRSVSSVLFAPVTLAANTDYDIVWTFGAASTVGTIVTMGETSENLPADVLACRPGGTSGYVDGTVGSFTPDTAQLMPFRLLIDSLPAAVAGGTVGYAN